MIIHVEIGGRLNGRKYGKDEIQDKLHIRRNIFSVLKDFLNFSRLLIRGIS